MENVSAFRTTDGALFDQEWKAKKHQATINLCARLIHSETPGESTKSSLCDWLYYNRKNVEEFYSDLKNRMEQEL